MYVLHRGIQGLNRYLPATSEWWILYASIPVALATGTLFVYSIYATQLADKCHLDAAQGANLNISATIGSAIGGMFSGLLTDRYGTQLPILMSCLSISLGYRWLWSLYNQGPASSMGEMLAAMFLVGLGSVSGYFSSLKAVAISFPEYKGSAQSVTISSFAISSLLYSIISTKYYTDDVGGFLEFLYVSCGIMLFIGFVFVRIDGHIDQEELVQILTEDPEVDIAETNIGGLAEAGIKESVLSGIFAYHYFMLAFIQGFGQMYIYSVGYILKAIHYYYSNKDTSMTSGPSLGSLQAWHVSLIGIASFMGRVSSGPQSDFLVKRLQCQRHWNLVMGLSIMLVGHILYTININESFGSLHAANVFLSFISVIIGYAYGFSFSCYPAIIADIFNMRNYSFIWGLMYSATTFGLTLMTKIFGTIYDYNSDPSSNLCLVGSQCYNLTFQITSLLCIILIGAILGYIYTMRIKGRRPHGV